MADDDETAIVEKGCSQETTANSTPGRKLEERIISNYYLEEYSMLDNLKLLKQNSLKTGLRNSRFRSLCWRIFLGCLPGPPNERSERIRSLRVDYEKICNAYHHDPRSVKTDDLQDNPLSQEETSHWNRYFSDDELLTLIKQDVVRAFPGMDFFQTDKIQTIMSRILFNYARENSQIEYKQGMHEILAPIIFIIHSDHQSYLFAEENGLEKTEIQELLDPNYLEHDSYFLFSHVMERIESWYDNSSVQTVKKNEYVNMEPFSNDNEFNCYSKIGVKLKMITEQILRRYDEKLFNHLRELKILPQIYGIRWMRLLFIREFQMEDLLVIWDAIFADDFGLCDYIFAAMLVVIRGILLASDYADCLNHLMRYPLVCDVHYVIHLALHIREPLRFPEPVEHSTSVLPNPNAIKVQRANRVNLKGSKSSNSLYMENEDSKTFKISLKWLEEKISKKLYGEGEKVEVCCTNALLASQLKYKIDFCAHYMSKNLDTIQTFINAKTKGVENSEQEDDESIENVLISLAELKKIRDILIGTIAFENSLT